MADALGIGRVHLFAFGTVFSAYGSAISDVRHVYERAVGGDAASLRDAGQALLAQARRDLVGEGFDPAAARYAWTLANDARREVTAKGAGAKVFEQLATRLPDGTLLRLDARFALGAVTLPSRPRGPAPAPSGSRDSALAPAPGLPVYQHAELAGHAIVGPCVVDGGTFTWLLEPGWRLEVDAHGDGVATREARA